MNPVIVIPTYWAKDATSEDAYDHATPIDAAEPELARCLDSLEKVRGVMRTCILLVASPDIEMRARERVDAIATQHPRLSPVVIGASEASLVVDEVARVAPTMPGEGIALRGYGAIRNMGLAVAAILGHDVVVFLDDDEVVLEDSFLLDAVYGLGRLTREGEPIVAKSGFFLNAEGSAYAPEHHVPWCDRDWNKHAEFNQWMRTAMAGPRISRSNHVCGGCVAIHAEAFTRVSFDPFITRGEDLDYLVNMRFYGLDVFFDNRWRVQHLPPVSTNPPQRFRQNVYRWIYERAKLQFSASIIGFNRVTPSSLMPYPGQWMSPSIDERARRTALRRAIAIPEHRAYLELWRHGIEDARAHAEATKALYLSFQTWWPPLMEQLWDERTLALKILGSGIPEAIREQQRPDTTVVIVGMAAEAAEAQGLEEGGQVLAEIVASDVDDQVAEAVDSAVAPIAEAVDVRAAEAAEAETAHPEDGEGARP